MSTTTVRAGIRVPDLTDGADDHADWLSAMTTIDGIMAITGKGLLSGRPAAGTVAGKFYYATDTGGFYVTDGTTWQLVNPYPLTDQAVGTGSLRTLGVGALQAAAGNDARLSDARTPLAGSVVAASIAANAVLWAKMGFQTPVNFVQAGMQGAINGESNCRAGRALARVDFTTQMGLAEPTFLFPAAAAMVDISVSPKTITNVGLTNGYGIEGTLNSCCVGNGSQYCTVPNTVKQKYGSWGGWFKLSTKGQAQLMGMWASTGSDQSMRLIVTADGFPRAEFSTGGGALTGNYSQGNTYIADDKWHQIVCTWDGTRACVFVDGKLDSEETATLAIANNNVGGPLNQSATLVFAIFSNSTGGVAMPTGKFDEVFITKDVLNEDAVRFLYAKKFTHTLGTQPMNFWLNVQRRFRAASYTAADFTSNWAVTQPTVGSNQQGNTYVNDYGSAVGFNPGTAGSVQTDAKGPDGDSVAWYFDGTGDTSGSDATNFQTGLLPQTYGVWIKCNRPAARMCVYAQGTAAGGAGRQIDILTDGSLVAYGAGAVTTSQVIAQNIADGQWHFVVVVENLGKRLYVDGEMVDQTGISPASVTAGGALGIRIGTDLAHANSYVGNMAGWFYAKTDYPQELIKMMYQKGNVVFGTRVPLDPMPHVERADTAAVYVIFDEMDELDAVELIIV